MVRKGIKFSDGTRIFYEDANGFTQRFIEYAYSPQEKREMQEKPYVKSIIQSSVRKYNAGKYYYLKILFGISHGLDFEHKQQLYSELKSLHDSVGQEYDSKIINEDFKLVFGKYWRGNEIQCAAFFTTIYLAMLDLEDNRAKYPNSMGKTMVLKSCEAVILGDKDPSDAATMFEKKKNVISDDYYDDCDNDTLYEKYHGYNGYDDDSIDEGFDGFPEATWNVD